LHEPEQAVPAASECIGRQFQSKGSQQINNRAYVISLQWHNQRLKLTETAVSFSPHAKKFLGKWLRLPRV